MINSRYLVPVSKVVAALLFLIFNSPGLARGQERRGSIYAAPNPTVVRPASARQSKSNKKTPASAEESKTSALEQEIREGNEARDQNQYQTAYDHYINANKLNPKDARALYGLGNVHSDFLCSEASINYYLKALKLKSDYSDARVSLGYIYLREEQYAKAQEQFTLVLNKEPDHVAAQIGLGSSYAKQGKYDDALAQIDKVIKSKSVADQAKGYFARGDVYFEEEKDWTNAATEYERAIKLKPDLYAAYIKFAFSHLWLVTSKVNFERIRNGDIEETERLRLAAKWATDKINEAIRLGYTPPGVYSDLGLTLAYQRRFQEASDNLMLYTKKLADLKEQMPALASGCTAGFDRLNAGAKVTTGNILKTKGMMETDETTRNKLFQDAIKAYEESIALNESYGWGYSFLGNIYFELKKYEEAIRYYKQAIFFGTNLSEKAWTYAMLSNSYSLLGRHDQAIEHIREALKINPNVPDFYEILASTYVAQGDIEGSINELQKANELRIKLGLKETANPGPYYYLGSAYAIKYLQRGNEKDFDEALKFLKRAVEIQPKNWMYFQALGILYQRHSDADMSLANFDKAIGLAPKDSVSYFNIGRVYAELKNNNEVALQKFKEALRVKPDFAEAHRRLGQLYLRQKNDTEAIKCFQNAIKYDPKSVTAYIDLARVYRVQKNYDEATKLLTTAIGIAPKDAEPYQQLGLVHLALQNAEGALTNFNRAVEYDPKNSDTYFYLARVYSELLMDEDAALKQLLKGIEINPRDLDFDVAIAELHKRRKNYPEAIKYFESAIQKAPNQPWNYKDIAKIYELQGRNEDAIRYYDEALKRLSPVDLSTKELYLGRQARLRGKYNEAIEHFRKVSDPDLPERPDFEIGMVYVVSKNKKAALAQYERIGDKKSVLAEDLLQQIKEMK